MTTAHYVMQTIAYIVLALTSLFFMFAKLTFTGFWSAPIIKPLCRVLPFLAAIWLVLEILGVKY